MIGGDRSEAAQQLLFFFGRRVMPGKTVPPGGKVRFGPYTYTNAPAGRHIVLAEANCADDLGNTDTASTISLPPLPCSYRPTPLVDLVANDNNLGLRVRGP